MSRHAGKSQSAQKQIGGNRRMRARLCRECGWHYVLVGGAKEHTCPSASYSSLKRGRRY